ncbi:hypothetical protein BD626DRAFT_566004 [Schizophyllum amplum]|uniref:Uncharacterized protein n=1 Tax=Schizophyllum amplum TaxID=97359 RepID=A0A550CQ70_9AGAR|nr:hypothetical protein BD626DRAFT_566004 [Auriculariopsis ampla]
MARLSSSVTSPVISGISMPTIPSFNKKSSKDTLTINSALRRVKSKTASDRTMGTNVTNGPRLTTFIDCSLSLSDLNAYITAKTLSPVVSPKPFSPEASPYEMLDTLEQKSPLDALGQSLSPKPNKKPSSAAELNSPLAKLRPATLASASFPTHLANSFLEIDVDLSWVGTPVLPSNSVASAVHAVRQDFSGDVTTNETVFVTPLSHWVSTPNFDDDEQHWKVNVSGLASPLPNDGDVSTLDGRHPATLLVHSETTEFGTPEAPSFDLEASAATPSVMGAIPSVPAICSTPAGAVPPPTPADHTMDYDTAMRHGDTALTYDTTLDYDSDASEPALGLQRWQPRSAMASPSVGREDSHIRQAGPHVLREPRFACDDACEVLPSKRHIIQAPTTLAHRSVWARVRGVTPEPGCTDLIVAPGQLAAIVGAPSVGITTEDLVVSFPVRRVSTAERKFGYDQICKYRLNEASDPLTVDDRDYQKALDDTLSARRELKRVTKMARWWKRRAGKVGVEGKPSGDEKARGEGKVTGDEGQSIGGSAVGGEGNTAEEVSSSAQPQSTKEDDQGRTQDGGSSEQTFRSSEQNGEAAEGERAPTLGLLAPSANGRSGISTASAASSASAYSRSSAATSAMLGASAKSAAGMSAESFLDASTESSRGASATDFSAGISTESAAGASTATSFAGTSADSSAYVSAKSSASTSVDSPDRSSMSVQRRTTPSSPAQGKTRATTPPSRLPKRTASGRSSVRRASKPSGPGAPGSPAHVASGSPTRRAVGSPALDASGSPTRGPVAAVLGVDPARLTSTPPKPQGENKSEWKSPDSMMAFLS